MSKFLEKIPAKVLVFLSVIGFLWVGLLLSYTVIFQNRSIELWGIRLDGRPETPTTKYSKSEGENKTSPASKDISAREVTTTHIPAKPPGEIAAKNSGEIRAQKTESAGATTVRSYDRGEQTVDGTSTTSGLQSGKNTPSYIADVYKTLRSMKKRVDEANPNGIAQAGDVSAFNQYLTFLQKKTEQEEIRNMRHLYPENYIQLRDLKAALSGLLVTLELNYNANRE